MYPWIIIVIITANIYCALIVCEALHLKTLYVLTNLILSLALWDRYHEYPLFNGIPHVKYLNQGHTASGAGISEYRHSSSRAHAFNNFTILLNSADLLEYPERILAGKVQVLQCSFSSKPMVVENSA